jgi:hypothetical protein
LDGERDGFGFCGLVGFNVELNLLNPVFCVLFAGEVAGLREA